jgi:tRNA (cmo5U34)-methyltransferase
MDQVKQHFENEAREFDQIILTLIPDYPEMVEALVSTIPFGKESPIRVIDLGCGTGTVAYCVLRSFPNAHLTCVDLAANMIAIARSKLVAYPDVRFVEGDFNSFTFDGQYDAVVSSLALHHLATAEGKKRFYRLIYESLAPAGVLYNADVVLASNDHLQRLYMAKWRAFMQRSISREEIENKWILKYEAEDHPAKLLDQMTWLAEIGFTDVDVIWKHYNFAVYGGTKR